MTSTASTPLLDQLRELLAHQGIDELHYTPRSWDSPYGSYDMPGLDIWRGKQRMLTDRRDPLNSVPADSSVRIWLDDGDVHLRVRQGWLDCAEARFHGMPASVIVATVAAYLT
jgi:hypothetical protein